MELEQCAAAIVGSMTSGNVIEIITTVGVMGLSVFFALSKSNVPDWLKALRRVLKNLRKK